MPFAVEELRKLLGRWTTGVTIVTARVGEKIHGMTVSAFTEVSLDPPLVLVCAERSSNTNSLIADGGVFALNILARDQEALSKKFASKEEEWQRFDGVDWDTEATGAPILPNIVAALDCRVVAAHEAGDHVIYVGRVEALRLDESRKPLVYQSGSYGRFDRGRS